MRILQLGSLGNDVMRLQSVLRKAGFDAGLSDGSFGQKTLDAAVRFQRRFGLTPDGIAGPETWRTLEQFLLGYDICTVRRGETLYSIARRYGADPESVIAANPGSDPQSLQVGRRIVVPYRFDVVSVDVGYSYDVLTVDLQGLKARYPFLQVANAGSSVLGRTLFTLRLGTGPNQVFYSAVHRATEWITAPVLMKFAEEFLKAYAFGVPLGGYRPRDLWTRCSVFLVPMVDPDGVDLVLNGLSPDHPYNRDLARWNGGVDFSRWDADTRGVDLSCNYDAAWRQAKEREMGLGVTGPGPARFCGPAPLSEPESRSMVRFTQSHDFRLVAALREPGRTIGWNFGNMAPPEARVIAENLAAIGDYALEEPSADLKHRSGAGYQDWFVQEYHRPGYTLSLGLGENPLPLDQFDGIYREALDMLLYAATI